MEKVFYHFTVTSLLKGVPRLISKIVNSGGQKILAICSDENSLKELDNELWTFSTKEFIPHDIVGCKMPEMHQVLLSTNDNTNLNNAEIIIFYNHFQDVDSQKFKKAIFVFYGNQDEVIVENAIKYFQNSKLNAKCTFWEQSDDARWISK